MRNIYPIIAASILLISSSTADENLCPCKFDGNDDLQNCRVYGQIGDDKLIPWYLASQDCLDAHNIKISAIPSYTLESMCNPPNSNAFVNYLKFEVRGYIHYGIGINCIYITSCALLLYFNLHSQPLPLQV